MGIGDGTFSAPAFYNAGGLPFQVHLADLNNDNHQDIVVANLDGSHTIGVLLGNGNGTFQNPIATNVGLNVTGMVTCDFNKDGNQDLIVTGYPSVPNEGYISTLIGDGHGTFTNLNTFPASSRSLLTQARSIATADLNGDTYPDFAVVAPENGFAVISFLNNGNGTFSRRAEMQVAIGGQLALADFNGDGIPDMAMTVVADPALGSGEAGANVAVAMGNGDGTFGYLNGGAPLYWMENVSYYGAGDDAYSAPQNSIVAVEMDGDGLRDLVLLVNSITDGNDYVAFLRGQSSGAFSFVRRAQIENNAVWASVAEINGDGAPDFVVTPNSAMTQAFVSGAIAPVFTSPSNATFLMGANNNFNVTATGYPAPVFSMSGILPAGVSFTSQGVLSGTPSEGTNGTYPVTITASNSSGQVTNQSFTLTVTQANLVVTTIVDEDDGSPNPSLGTGTSLREAINFANTLAGSQTITFAPDLAAQTFNLTLVGDSLNGTSALRVTGSIIVQGLTGNSGIVIRRGIGGELRPFLVDLGGSLTLNDLTIADGVATFGGGVFNKGTLTMNRCTLRNNSASTAGGALYSGGGGSGQTGTLTNCTFANNEAIAGGAIQNDSGSTLQLTNVTVTANTLSSFNPALGAGISNVGSLTMINTIVAGNHTDGQPSDVSGSVNPASSHNLIGEGGSGGLVHGVAGNLVGIADPRLGELAWNGGPTQTLSLDGSLAVNAGTTVPGVTTDQRGVARPQHGAPDIGAYEYDGPLEGSLVVTTREDEFDFTSNPAYGAGTSLREALHYAQSLGGPRTILFSPDLAGQTIILDTGWSGDDDANALQIDGQITLQGPTTGPGITIAVDGVQKRHLLVTETGSATISHLTFTGGYGDYGGSVENLGQFAVRNCTFTGNHSTQDGGAVHSSANSQLLSIENSTFSGNSTDGLSSAVATGAAVTNYRYLTITNNTGGSGAILLYEHPVTMINSIVAGNTPDGVLELLGSTFSDQSTNNILGTGGSGGLTNGTNGNLVGLALADLHLGSLSDHGGPTWTVPLLANSPALNAGVLLANPTSDQRGIARPVGPAPDIGAYEFAYGVPVFTSLDNALFKTNRSNSFYVSAISSPAATFSFTGTLPAGVTLDADGLLSGNPPAGTEGTYVLTITASNGGRTASQSFTLTVSSNVLTVTTTVDEDDGTTDPATGTGTSLREAINFANGEAEPQIITFSPALAGQTINLNTSIDATYGPTAFYINNNITIQGLAGSNGITISRGTSDSLRLFIVTASLTLNDLTLSNGHSTVQGGGAVWNLGTLHMNRCTLSGNESNLGGAIAAGTFAGGQQNTFLTNCTLAHNVAYNGGAIYNYPSSAFTLTNVTIVDNVASNAGGGVYNRQGSLLSINSIIARNETTEGAPSDVTAESPVDPASHHNVIGTGGSGGPTDGVNGNIVGITDPLVGSLASNGGPAKTVALLQGSPAVNSAATVAGITTDQRGIQRPQAGAPDIGAYEYNGPFNESLVVTTTVDEFNHTSDPAYGTGTSLREALAYASSAGGAQTITFAPSMAGQTVMLDAQWSSANQHESSSAFVVSGNITVQGLTNSAGVTLAVSPSAQLRHFLVKEGGSLTVAHLTLSGGQALTGGFAYGGSVWNFGSLTVRNCTFTDNTADVEGGAIQSWGESTLLAIDNSTFTGNTSNGDASAIMTGAIANTFRFVTITNNTTTNGTGAALSIYKYGVTMVNSIVAGNNIEGIGTLASGAFTAQSTNNILGSGGTAGLSNGVNGNRTGVTTSELKFGSFGNNGGPTPTIPLLPGSLAIDTGVSIGGLLVDQRGTSRTQNGSPDIGAFEFVQSAAAAPVINPFGGTFQDRVLISISSTSQPTIVRYTLDGSNPTTTHGLIYSGPFTLERSATVRAVAYGSGWLNSPITSVPYVVLPPLPHWRNVHSLAADGSQDQDNPSGDGISNLLKYAFNMAPDAGDLALPDISILPEDGLAGLPFITIDDEGRLVMEFLRRKSSTNPGIIYIPETTGDLTGWNSLSLADAEIVAIDSIWERVTVTDPEVAPTRFGRIRILSLGAYFNDFNSGLGAATLRGDAAHANQSVRLTDTIDSQYGAVIFDGIPLEPEVTGFTARFNLQLGPSTTGTPADGASFAVGDLGTGPWGETGPGGTHHIAIGFDTFNNDGTGSVGIHLWVNGVHIATNATNPYTNGELVPVEIIYDAGDGITVKYNGAVIFDKAEVNGFTFQTSDAFGIGARTGALTEVCIVDDVEITTR